MSSPHPLFDAAGRRRSPATMPGHNAGRAPRNKGMHYPADPPTVDEIAAVMRQTPPDRHGLRLRALIVVLWRGGLRIQEALTLIESDLDPRRGSILVRRGKGNKRREVGMDSWAWSDHLAPWLARRIDLPVGPLFCVIDGPTRGRPWSATAVRDELRRYALAAGVRRRFAPHQLRHAHAVELACEGAPLPVIRRQLGHSYVSTTSVHLQASMSRRSSARSTRGVRRRCTSAPVASSQTEPSRTPERERRRALPPRVTAPTQPLCRFPAAGRRLGRVAARPQLHYYATAPPGLLHLPRER